MKPITRKEIVVGRQYLHMQVHADGSMHLHQKAFYGKPVKHAEGFGSYWVRTAPKKRGKWTRLDPHCGGIESLTDLGVDVPLDERYNIHAVFESTPENRAALEDLVKRQDLAAYVKLAGFGGNAELVERLFAARTAGKSPFTIEREKVRALTGI